jgi:hypothetical protein
MLVARSAGHDVLTQPPMTRLKMHQLPGRHGMAVIDASRAGREDIVYSDVSPAA